MREAIIDLARRAGALILTHYDAAASTPLEIVRKADDSPLTIADREANESIVAGLRFVAPDVPVISEEGAAIPFEERRGWQRFFLVDPLDGTKEFIKRNGEFTVNIALVEDGIPTLGVVFAPALGVLYVGERGAGASKIEPDGEERRIYSAAPPEGRPLRVVTSRSHASDDVAALLGGRAVGEIVPVGSSLKLCFVAEGRADVYPRRGPTMEWDVAAGDAVYRASGRDGERSSPLRYNKPSLRNDGFLIGLDP